MKWIFFSWHEEWDYFCRPRKWKKYPSNPRPKVKKMYLQESRNDMRIPDNSMWFMTPNMILYRRKINHISTILVFWYFWKSARKWWKRVDWLLFCTILQINIKLNNIEWLMCKFDVTHTKWSLFYLSIFDFYHLDITIVSVELTREKSCKFVRRRKKESNLPSRWYNLKTKCRMNFGFPKLPPWAHVFDSMMEGRKHFTCDKYTLFISAIDWYFIRDERGMTRQMRGDK